MEHLEPYTPEFPRESLRARFINFGPSILVVVFMILGPAPTIYIWTRLAFQSVGFWSIAPVAVAIGGMSAYAAFVYRTAQFLPQQGGQRSDRITLACRAACVLFIVGMLTVFGNAVIVTFAYVFDPDEEQQKMWALKTAAVGACAILVGYAYIYSTYQRYWLLYYEKAILDWNAERYGETVLVSIPVFKLCGHFVLYTSTHKYELRLDRSTGFRPYFLHRPRHPQDSGTSDSPRYHFFVCGWTKKRHEEIVNIFEEVINQFGEYNRVTNNCRTFLQDGIGQIVHKTSVWHEDMLMVDVGNALLVAQMAIMMYRAMLRELCRWMWTLRWGPDWESSVYYNGLPVDLADHDIHLEDIFD